MTVIRLHDKCLFHRLGHTSERGGMCLESTRNQDVDYKFIGKDHSHLSKILAQEVARNMVVLLPKHKSYDQIYTLRYIQKCRHVFDIFQNLAVFT